MPLIVAYPCPQVPDHYPQVLAGMSAFASTRMRRGTRTTRSSGPQPAEGGMTVCAWSVMSMPMMAKSPSASSQMSGQF